MFVGCSEISLSVIVKHIQPIGINIPFCLPRWTCYVFYYLGDRKKLLGCSLLVGITTQTETTVVLVNFKYVNAD